MIGNVYRSGSYLQSLFLLIVRLVVGSSFFIGGWGKLQNIDNVIEYFSSIGIPFPVLNAYIVAGIEFSCGILLFIGFISRLAGLLLAIVMIVAIYIAHYDLLVNIFQDPFQLIITDTFIFLASSLMIFIFGPGKVSIDHAISLE